MPNEITIKFGGEMDRKLAELLKVKVDVDNYCTYYIDNLKDEKWVKEHLYGEMHGGGPAQLRLLDKFPWE